MIRKQFAFSRYTSGIAFQVLFLLGLSLAPTSASAVPLNIANLSLDQNQLSANTGAFSAQLLQGSDGLYDIVIATQQAFGTTGQFPGGVSVHAFTVENLTFNPTTGFGTTGSTDFEVDTQLQNGFEILANVLPPSVHAGKKWRATPAQVEAARIFASGQTIAITVFGVAIADHVPNPFTYVLSGLTPIFPVTPPVAPPIVPPVNPPVFPPTNPPVLPPVSPPINPPGRPPVSPPGTPPAQVPEPASIFLLGSALVGIRASRKRTLK